MNNNVDAIIITGQDQNIMGIETTSTRVPIIDAKDMNPQQVEQMLNNWQLHAIKYKKTIL